MHRDIALALLPAGTPADMPALMAREIVSHGVAGESPVAILQRAGYPGADIAAHIDEARTLADVALRRAALPNPQLGILTRALAGALTAYPELTQGSA